MEQVAFGTRVRSMSIPRCDVANGMKGRAVMIDPNVAVKQIAYDDVNKCRVEITSQEESIELKLAPRATFYLLIARLNTDMQGNVASPDFQVEYVQMAESVYNDFLDQAEQVGTFQSLLLQKFSRSASDQYGYVKPIAAPAYDAQIPQEVYDRIESMRNTPGVLEGIWAMIDQATSLTVEQYRQRLANNEQNGGAPAGRPAIAARPQAPRPALNGGTTRAAAPKPAPKAATKPAPKAAAPKPAQPAQEAAPEATVPTVDGEGFGDFDAGGEDFGGSDFS